MDGERLVRDASPAWLRAGVESSLKALGTDYIDLYQVHWPDPATPIHETATALDALVREGKIHFVGVSNFDVAQMAEFGKTRKLDALQPPYDLFRRDVEREILPYCKAHGIGVLVYGPLAHGLLSGTMNEHTTFAPNDWRSKSPLFRGEQFAKNLDAVSALKAFAAKRGISVAQLAIAWTLANPAVDVAIVGVRIRSTSASWLVRPHRARARRPARDRHDRSCGGPDRRPVPRKDVIDVESTQNIAVLGVGTMGSAFARRLLGAGMRVSVWDVSPAAAARLAKRAPQVAATPEEAVRDAGVVLTMVPTIASIEETMPRALAACRAALSGCR